METWVCDECGNVNYNDCDYQVCLNCKWDSINAQDSGFRWQCPVCDNYGEGAEGSYDICARCLWEDDSLQRDEPDYWGGANSLSLNESRLEYRLSQNKATSQQASEALKKHQEIRASIYLKYQDIDYRVDGDKIGKELKTEHDRYVLALKALAGI